MKFEEKRKILKTKYNIPMPVEMKREAGTM